MTAWGWGEERDRTLQLRPDRTSSSRAIQREPTKKILSFLREFVDNAFASVYSTDRNVSMCVQNVFLKYGDRLVCEYVFLRNLK